MEVEEVLLNGQLTDLFNPLKVRPPSDTNHGLPLTGIRLQDLGPIYPQCVFSGAKPPDPENFLDPPFAGKRGKAASLELKDKPCPFSFKTLNPGVRCRDQAGLARINGQLRGPGPCTASPPKLYCCHQRREQMQQPEPVAEQWVLKRTKPKPVLRSAF